MDLLAHLTACLFVVVGCHEYTTAECAEDVFFLWHDVATGDRPIACDYFSECLPMDWEGLDVRRRSLEPCTC